MKTSFLNLFIVSAIVFAATYANAQSSLTLDFQRTIASEQTPFGGEARFYHVSINSNNPGIGGFAAAIPGTNDLDSPFVRPIDQDPVAYKWIGGTNDDISGVSLEGLESTRIVYTTQDTTFDGFGQNQLKFWDLTDPGADISTGGPDPFNVNTFDANPSGYRSFGGAVTTTDITGLGTGTLYVFYGAFNATPSLNVVMRDLDGSEPDIVIADAHSVDDGGNGDFANRTEYYVAELDFVNADGYDVIEYTHLANGTDFGGNGRGLGTLLTGSEEIVPSILEGDYNEDGTVNLADYTVWRNNLGAPAGTLPNDPDDTLPIGTEQYDTWADNFGDSSNIPMIEASVVPEPSSLALLAGIAGFGLFRLRSRR